MQIYIFPYSALEMEYGQYFETPDEIITDLITFPSHTPTLKQL